MMINHNMSGKRQSIDMNTGMNKMVKLYDTNSKTINIKMTSTTNYKSLETNEKS